MQIIAAKCYIKKALNENSKAHIKTVLTTSKQSFPMACETAFTHLFQFNKNRNVGMANLKEDTNTYQNDQSWLRSMKIILDRTVTLLPKSHLLVVKYILYLYLHTKFIFYTISASEFFNQ